MFSNRQLMLNLCSVGSEVCRLCASLGPRPPHVPPTPVLRPRVQPLRDCPPSQETPPPPRVCVLPPRVGPLA